MSFDEYDFSTTEFPQPSFSQTSFSRPSLNNKNSCNEVLEPMFFRPSFDKNFLSTQYGNRAKNKAVKEERGGGEYVGARLIREGIGSTFVFMLRRIATSTTR